MDLQRIAVNRVFLFLLVFLTSLAFASTGKALASTPKKGGTLTVGINTDITTLDPHTSTALINSIILNHVYEPLLGYGENLKIMPILAESWKMSPDKKNYTFNLMKGKRFHNGREMVAEDVKYSLERMMTPATKNPQAPLFKDVDKVEVVDKYTVKVSMKEPFTGFPHVLAYIAPIMAILPKEEVEKQGGVIRHPVGTGPFKFVEWQPDRHVILERFDQYKSASGPRNGITGERLVYLDKIKFLPIPEESVAIMALLNKEIDLYNVFPPASMDRYQSDYSKRGIVLDEVPGLVWTEIFFGVSQPVTGNLKFRQACAYAIDQEAVAKASYQGLAKVNPSAVSIQNQYWTPYHKTWYKKDPEKAKQLLKEAGYKGEEVVIDTTKKYMYMYRMAVGVQAELAAVGINAKINVLEWPVLLKKNIEGNFQIQTFGAAPMPDPTMAYAYLKRNKFEEKFPRASQLREAAMDTDDFETRKKIFEELHKITYEQVPWIIFFHYPRLEAYWNYVKGYKILNTTMVRLWGVWLEK